MERCNGCGRKKEDTSRTAYLIDRSKKEGVCPECKDRLEQEDMDKYTHDALEDFCNIVNGKSYKELGESLFRSIQREHRYLQNEFFLALFEFFKLYGAQDENHRDARNEWAVRVAKRWDAATFD
jgi:hypothetical protein